MQARKCAWVNVSLCWDGWKPDHEERLVAGDHPLQNGDDGRALLGPGWALDAELLVWVLLFVEQVGPEDGG